MKIPPYISTFPLFSAFVGGFAALIFLPVPPASAHDIFVVAQAEISEKEAYEASKELGTIEAWEAFLTIFPPAFAPTLPVFT